MGEIFTFLVGKYCPNQRSSVIGMSRTYIALVWPWAWKVRGMVFLVIVYGVNSYVENILREIHWNGLGTPIKISWMCQIYGVVLSSLSLRLVMDWLGRLALGGTGSRVLLGIVTKLFISTLSIILSYWDGFSHNCTY